jgi:ribosomal-protein-alanine N-acetyltransferase
MIEAVGAQAAELLAFLHARAFDKPWSAAEIAGLMENPAVFALVSRDAPPHDVAPSDAAPNDHGANDRTPNPAKGFVLAWAAAGDAELLTVAVIPEARRKGVAASLVSAASVTALVRGAASMHLEVAQDNLAARALYAKLGYEEAGRRHAYYAGEGGFVDAIVMKRTLPRPLV